MATLTGHLVADTYKALLKMIDNDILTAAEKQISDGLGGGTNVFIDQNGFLRANKYKVTGATSSQFLKGDGSLDSTAYLPVGTTTTNIPEGTNLYFTTNRVLNTLLTGFAPVSGTVTATDSILTAINKIWWNIVNGGGGGGGGYVPYTGALQNLNLGTYGLISDFVQFNTTNSSIPTTAGTMSWNDTDGTADLKLKGGNVTLQIGQEEVIRVVNKTGASLEEADFRAVRIRSVAEGGAQGQRLAVVLAQADSDAHSATTIGIVTETIANNQEGFITSSGEVKEINTTGAKSWAGAETWVDGDILYLSPTHAGYLTKVKPQAPEHTIIIGWVSYAHAVHGKIFVKVDNGYELDELHNVKITSPVNDDFLMYDSTQSVWINKDLHGTKGYLPYYFDTKVFEQSPIFTDGSKVVIGGIAPYNTTDKFTVFNGNISVDDSYGYNIGYNRVLDRNTVSGQIKLGTTVANDYLVFYANSIERMRLNASGYLGIGLTSPTQPLHVKGVLAYPKIIIDNNSTSGGGVFSAYQNGTETANFGISGAWLLDSSSDVAIVATRAGNGIQFYTNGSTSEKMGINSDGNVFVGQTPTYVAGATQLIVRGKTGAGFSGVMHYDMSIKGSMNTFNNVFQVGTSTFHSVAVIVEDIERARFNSSGRMLLGTTTDNTVDMLQVNGSIIGTSIKKSGGTSSQYLMADGSVSTLGSFVPTSRTLTINGTAFDLSADRSWSVGTVTSVSASVPTGFSISGSPITTSGTLAITFATGYSLPTTMKQSNWDSAYSFTSVFPSQTGNSGKYLTTDGTNLSWGTVTAGVSSFNTRTGAVTLSSSDVTGALGYTPVTNARTLTINGTAYDLSADRSWTITPGSGMRNVQTFTATSGQTTFTITGGYTVGLIDVFVNGARLSSSDYTATSGTNVILGVGVVTNDIVDIVAYTASATSGITGSGTTNYIAKWSGSSAITNSLIFDNGTNVGIGTALPSEKLEISGSLRLNDGNADGPQLRLASLGYSDWNIDNFSGSLRAYYGSTEYLRVTNIGQLLIGTSTASSLEKVSIVGSASYNGVVRIENNVNPIDVNHGILYLVNTVSYAVGNDASVMFGAKNSGGVIHPRASIGAKTASDLGANLVFNTRNDSEYSERMRITSSGNVGIGTTSPTQKLDVNGAIKTLGDYYSVNNTPFSTNGTITYHDTVGLTLRGATGYVYDFAVYNTSSTALFVNPTGSTTMSFPSGNVLFTGGIVGIGTTTPSEGYGGTIANVKLALRNGTPGSAGGTSVLLIGGDNNHYASITGSHTGGGNTYLAFATSTGAVNPSEKMRITSAGNICINTTAPIGSSQLTVVTQSAGGITGYFLDSPGDTSLYWYSYSNSIQIESRTAAGTSYRNICIAGNGGNVGIRLGATMPSYTLQVNGSVAGVGGYVNWSDARLKKDVKPLENSLQNILSLNGITYNWNKKSNSTINFDDDNHIGLLAQDVEKILPQVVSTTKDEFGTKAIAYSDLVPVLIEAIKELNAKIESLEAK